VTTKYFNVKNGLTTGNIILDAGNSSIVASVVTANNSVNFGSASNVALGSNTNVHITGGSSGQYLQTDGAGNLSWATISSSTPSNITNGTSNVNIATSNGNVTVSVNGTANVVTITANGIETSNVTANNFIAGSGSGGNLTGADYIFANYFVGNGSLLTSITGANVIGTIANAAYAITAGTVTTNAQPNITSVGTLTSLTSSGNISASYFIGNGSQLTSITGANVTGYVPLSTSANTATTAGTVTTAAQPNITSVGTLTGLTSTGVINFLGTSNVSLGSNANVKITGGSSGQYLQTNGSGNLSWATIASVTPSNITNGTSNVNISASGGNITASVGGTANVVTITTSGLVLSGNLTASGLTLGSGTGGNLTDVNYVVANYFSGNGSLLTSITGANVTGYVPLATAANTATSATTAGTVTTAAQPNITSVGTLTSLTSSGNISASYFIGNGYSLTAINGSNVLGVVTSATTAGTITTAAQPNITSVGTLTGLTVNGVITQTGNLNITGNINVTGNLNYSNVSDLVVGDPLIYIGANNTGNLYDLGIVASYNDGGYQHTGLARDHTDGVWKLFDDVVNEPTTTIDFANGTYAGFKSGAIFSTGNVTASYFIGNGSQLTGLPAGYSNTDAAAYLSSGSLSSNIITTGNISGAYFIGSGSTLANITGSNVTGYVPLATAANTATSATSATTAITAETVTTAAQPNITSVGTLTSLTSSGNISASYFIGNGSTLTFITGANVTGYVPLATSANTATSATTAGTVTTNAQPNITSTGTLTGLTSTGVIDFNGTSNVSLGSVSNLHISGGTSGYVLSTNGSGTLSWVAQTGGGGSASTITVDNFTGNGVQTSFLLSVTPDNINNTTLNYNGAVQLRSGYTLNGANVVFTTPPAANSSIEVTTISPVLSGAAGSNNYIQYNSGGSLAASADLTFNPSTSTLNATNITANGTPVASTGKAIAMAIVFGF
jgi:hypothetical protein